MIKSFYNNFEDSFFLNLSNWLCEKTEYQKGPLTLKLEGRDKIISPQEAEISFSDG